MNFLFLHPQPRRYGDFLWADIASIGFHQGLGIMAQMVKNYGHRLKVVSFSHTKDLEKVLSPGWDWIFLSSYSHQFPLICESLRIIANKPLRKGLVIGGVHATFAPETFQNYQYTFLVRGEGEIFLDRLLKKENLRTLPGVFYGGDNISSEFTPLVENLDNLPFAFRYLSPSACNRYLFIIGRRGCSHACGYCSHSAYKKVYRNFSRCRSPAHIISEIKEINYKRYRQIEFFDDNFLETKNWWEELIALYQKNIRLPFSIRARAINVNSETLKILKQSGCGRIHMGIEAGSHSFRSETLGRSESDERIVEAFRLANEAGIQTLSYSMLGLPQDTEASIKKLISLNRRANPTFIYHTIFQPFPGTPHAEYCKEHNLVYPFTDTYYRWNFKQLKFLPDLPGISKEKLAYYFINFVNLIREV